MTMRIWLLAAALAAGLAAQAANPPASTAPVADALRASLRSSAAKMTAAAEAMPADKYGFKPTPESMAFGQLILHIATSNESLCATISGAAPAPKTALTADSPKPDLVGLLQASFDYCTQAMANLDDSRLASLVGARRQTQASQILALSDDWADHYGQQAAYLRLNGILPPTAQPARGRG